MRSASARLDAAAANPAELPIALGEVNRALELAAGDAEAERVKSAIEAAVAARREAARVRAAVDNAGRRFANGKHHAAIKLLEDFDPPDHPDIVRALDQLRTSLQIIEDHRRAEQERVERQQRVAALVSDARAALEDKRFDEGLQSLATAEEIDSAAADVAPLRDEILRAQAAARLRADIDAAVAAVDERLSQNDVDGSRELLNQAIALSATDAAVVAARQRVEAAIGRREAEAAREREEAAAREREAAAAREREAAAAREREAAAAREREAAAAREREAAAAREREAAAAREREAAAAREREAAAAREREAAAAREREAAAAREREAATARERELVAARERDAKAARERESAARAQSAAPQRQVAADPTETLLADDLHDAVRAARESVRGGTPPQPSPAIPAADAGALGQRGESDSERARRTAVALLAAARAQLEAPALQIADVLSALQKIEQALAAVPGDVDALHLETTANEHLVRLRDAAKIDAAIRNARSRFAIGKHHAAIQLLEGLDAGAHPAVATALSELRAALHAIEERRRRDAEPKKPKIVDDDATHVILMPEILAKMQAEGSGPVAVAADVRTAPTAEPVAATTPPASDPDSQRRLILFGGVLLVVLIVALIILRFAP